MAERRIGPFIIGRQLGAGGMGVVYRAVYTETGREVALKVLPPGLIGDDKIRARFEREIGILKKLSHPNIVRYYGGGTHEGQRWYAMELIDGGAVSQLLKRRGRLTPEQAIEAGRQLCAALEHAHNAGIIHRDLKPGNLFITTRGRIKLGDFGIARDTEASPLTAAGKTVGTYAYMAPEQIRGSAAISRKTDLYAVGCLLYELLTGQTPFLADNPAEMLLAHMEHEPFPVRSKCPACPVALELLVLRLLEKDPDDRPFDALAVHTELTEIAASLKDGTAEPAGGPAALPQTRSAAEAAAPTKKKRKRRGRFFERTPFLVAALLLLIATTAWLLQGPSEQTLYERGREVVASVLRNPDRPDALSRLDDARRRWLEPARNRFPEGQYASETAVLLDQARSLTLELQAEVRLRTRRDGRNAFEKAAMEAFRAEQESAASPLIAIDRLQTFVEFTEGPGIPTPAEDSVRPAATESDSANSDVNQPALWNQAAQRRLAANRDAFLKRPNHEKLLRDYIEEAGRELQSDTAESAAMKLTRLIRVFENHSSVAGACDLARNFLDRSPKVVQ
jgi:hypothetical protein